MGGARPAPACTPLARAGPLPPLRRRPGCRRAWQRLRPAAAPAAWLPPARPAPRLMWPRCERPRPLCEWVASKRRAVRPSLRRGVASHALVFDAAQLHGCQRRHLRPWSGPKTPSGEALAPIVEASTAGLGPGRGGADAAATCAPGPFRTMRWAVQLPDGGRRRLCFAGGRRSRVLLPLHWFVLFRCRAI